MFHRILRAAALTLAIVAGLMPTATRAADEIDVLLALPTNTLTFASAFIAEDGGFFKKEGTGFKKDFKGGFKKAGPSFGKDRPAFKKEGFKKTFTGKAAGAKGSYKGGKAFRDKNK
jgi:hypothetical protein